MDIDMYAGTEFNFKFIAIAYGLGGWGSISGGDKRIYSTPQSPEWLWSQPSLLYNG
jgi:hypothetical protein